MVLSCGDGSTGLGESCDTRNISGYAIITEDGEWIGGSDDTDWCHGGGRDPEYQFFARPIPSDTLVYLHYLIPEPSRVTLLVFNEDGEYVDRLLDEQRAAGAHTYAWRVRDKAGDRLPPGLYRACLEAGEFGCYGDILIMEDASEFWSTVY